MGSMGKQYGASVTIGPNLDLVCGIIQPTKILSSHTRTPVSWEVGILFITDFPWNHHFPFSSIIGQPFLLRLILSSPWILNTLSLYGKVVERCFYITLPHNIHENVLMMDIGSFLVSISLANIRYVYVTMFLDNNIILTLCHYTRY